MDISKIKIDNSVLDVKDTTARSTLQLLGTASVKDAPASGNASNSQVVLGNDTRLSDPRPASDVYEWAKASAKPTYTKSEVGLGNVTNDSQVKRSEMGVASGVATLDSTGKVPSTQLPSYVDDVIEGYMHNGKFYAESTHDTLITGESGKIYSDLSTSKIYRWGGSAFAVISDTITVGTTQGTAFDGKSGYDHVNNTSNPHGVTKSQVGLGNVGNFKAVSTVASQDLTDAEKSNARANIGAGTSSFSGSYTDLTDKPTIPAAQIQADWNQTDTNALDFIKNKPSSLSRDAFGKIRVNLLEYLNNTLSNGSGLSGITVSVQNTTDNSAAITKTYSGNELVFDGLTPIKTYRISVESKTGYKLDYAYQDVISLDVGGDVTKTFKYEAYQYTAIITSSKDSEGVLDENVDRSSTGVYLIAQYSYGGSTVLSSLLHHGDTFNIPIDTDTSTFEIYNSSNVSGYSKTESIDTVNKRMLVAYLSLEITYETGYIILDQTSSDPTQKVIDESGKTYATGYTTPSVITTIRQMSHCYVGTFANNVMSLKQIDDADGTKYADGTSCASDITTKNVFMRLPYFYTKVSTYDTDKIKIEFWIDPSQNSSPSESGWKQWGGNDLIGKYEAKCTDTGNNASGTLQSISGAESTGGVSQVNFKTKARNGGTGFSIVKWRHQNIMAILFYAYYGHTNCQELVGYGENAYNGNTRTTGLKNSQGMADTNSANGNTNNIVFWGLENWWGCKAEWVDNVVVNNTDFVITEDNGTTRTVIRASTNGSAIYPNKFVLGDNLDTVAAPNESGGSDTTGYCDYQYFKADSSRVVYRSYLNANANGGVAFVYAGNDSSSTKTSCGSRLAFTGAVEIT